MEYDESGRESQRYGNSGPGTTLNTVSAVGVTVGFCLLLNRLFWRWKKGTPGLDDFLILVAWIFLLILGLVSMKAVDYGYGRKQSSLTKQEASDSERLFYVYQIFYKLTINTCKLSILVLYLRVFDTNDWFGNITKALLVIVTIYTFSILMANIFICSPISLYWNTGLPQAEATHLHQSQCINVLAYWYASSLYNILSETVMLFSVLIRVWTLPSHSHPPILQFRQKVNLTIVLGLGVFTIVTAILRMTTLSQTAMDSDKTGGTLRSTVWSSIEASLGIAVANLPMVRQLLKWRGWCGGRWFSSTAGKSREHSRSRRQSSRGANQVAAEVNQHENLEPLRNSRTGQHIQLQQNCGRKVLIKKPKTHDVEAQNAKFQRVEIESLPGEEFPIHSPHTTSGFRCNEARSESIGGATLKSRSDSNAPSFISTMAPTEPVPIIKISLEPSSIDLPPLVAKPTTLSRLDISR